MSTVQSRKEHFFMILLFEVPGEVKLKRKTSRNREKTSFLTSVFLVMDAEP
jgi:hypothetical protein